MLQRFRSVANIRLASALTLRDRDPEEERRLAYVALTRGMERVSISHVEYRRGYTRPSPFLLDIPVTSHVKGWLRAQRSDGGGPRRIGRHYVEDV